MLNNILEEEDDCFVFFYAENDPDAHSVLAELEGKFDTVKVQNMKSIIILFFIFFFKFTLHFGAHLQYQLNFSMKCTKMYLKYNLVSNDDISTIRFITENIRLNLNTNPPPHLNKILTPDPPSSIKMLISFVYISNLKLCRLSVD